MAKRIIKKGNEAEGGYDIRIDEPNGKSYYYHIFQLEDGEVVIHSPKAFNMKNIVDVLWDDLSIKMREAHYANLHPNDNLDEYGKNCFLYGKKKADKIVADEREKENQKREFLFKQTSLSKISYYMAEIIYDEIGPFDKVNIIY